MDVFIADIKYLGTYKKFLLECFNHGLEKYESALDDPKSYLQSLLVDSHLTSTYFCVQNDEILGAIRYRHHTNTYIKNVIGHVGYETKPTARGKGVAKFMLSWIQKHVLTDTIISTCEIDNIASKKIIERCGAKYLNQIYSPEKNSEIKRFQLEPVFPPKN
ncbi:MAG: putative acetyltransferase [Alteromonadaceae bacterium]|jgi:predicted acetyltransferase